MFINSDHRIIDQKETIEKLQSEILQLTTKRDKLILINEELLRVNTEINSRNERIRKDLYVLESIIEQTKKTLEKQQNDFVQVTGKQKTNIESLNQSIQARIDDFKKIEGKELIDFDSENLRIKGLLQQAREELARTEDKDKKMKEDQERFYKFKEKEALIIEYEKEKNKEKQKELELKQQQLEEENRRLAMREQKIRIMEKQIENFKIS